MNLDKNIGWCTHTHNIMTGCKNQELGICNVDACYARKTAENPFYRKVFPYGFEPHFYEDRIWQIQKLQKPAIVFMDSMSDIFGSWWTDEQILKVLHVMDSFRGVYWHKYVVLTKNPARMVEILGRYCITDGSAHLDNVYFGTSITGLGDAQEASRLICLHMVHRVGFKIVLSIEPFLHDPTQMLNEGCDITWLNWIIVGGQTKPTKEPPEEWILKVANATYHGQPLFIKKNCGGEYGNHFHDFPADLLPIAQAWGKA